MPEGSTTTTEEKNHPAGTRTVAFKLIGYEAAIHRPATTFVKA
jgi:hypothetical protein